MNTHKSSVFFCGLLLPVSVIGNYKLSRLLWHIFVAVEQVGYTLPGHCCETTGDKYQLTNQHSHGVGLVHGYITTILD